jgi:hypothetical protein
MTMCLKKRVKVQYIFITEKTNRFFLPSPYYLLKVLFLSSTQTWIAMHRVTRPAGIAPILIAMLTSDEKTAPDKGRYAYILLISSF